MFQASGRRPRADFLSALAFGQARALRIRFSHFRRLNGFAICCAEDHEADDETLRRMLVQAAESHEIANDIDREPPQVLPTKNPPAPPSTPS